MCVARAQEAVFDFLEQYLEPAVSYIVFSNLAKDWHCSTQAQSMQSSFIVHLE